MCKSAVTPAAEQLSELRHRFSKRIAGAETSGNLSRRAERRERRHLQYAEVIELADPVLRVLVEKVGEDVTGCGAVVVEDPAPQSGSCAP